MNRNLLLTSILATLGTILVYSLNPNYPLPILLALISLLFSYIASFSRYITPIGFLVSIFSSAFPFFSSNSSLFLAVLVLGILALANPWIWEFLLLIWLSIFSLIPSTPPIVISFFSASLFSSLAFANLYAAMGRGDAAELRIEGLPDNVTWYAEINGVFKGINKNVIKDSKKIEAIICPQYISGIYYIPDKSKVIVKQGKKEVVKFQKSSAIPPSNKFSDCFAYFQCKGLPTNIKWSIIVNGVEYSAPTTSVIAVPLLNTKEISWRAREINVGQVIFKPSTSMGIAKRGDKITIEYTSLVQGVVQTSLPPLNKWDPKVWVGKELYGYKVQSVIASGGNGYVLKAEKDGTPYAIKVFSVSSSSNVTVSTYSNFDSIFKESETLKNLSTNPKFVRIYGIFIDLNNLKSILKGDAQTYYNYPPAIIMEYMSGGTSLDLAQNQAVAYSSYWPLIVKEIVKEVASALAFLHSNGFVHLDVKPENIFFSRELGKYPDQVYKNILGSVKLGDLGSAVRIGEKINQATPGYCPPEQIEAVILGRGADPKMDIFALGMTAYVLLTLKKDNPAADLLDKAIDSYLSGNVGEALKNVQLAKQVLASWRPILPQNTPQDLANVIFRSLSVDPRYRPTADEIVRSLS